ncbi:hypothetical protein PO909_017280 [Leuciscus waleckii]
MFAAGMLQQSSGGLNKRSLGMARLPNSHFFPLSSGSGSWGLGRSAKSGSLSSVSSGSDSMDMAGADPDYIMQLVNEVRRFADVLLHLKEAFNTKGTVGISPFVWRGDGGSLTPAGKESNSESCQCVTSAFGLQVSPSRSFGP